MENAYGNVMDRRMVITGSTALHRFLIEAQLCQNGMMHSSKMKADPGENYANVHEQMAGSGTLSGYSSTQITLLSPKQSKSKKCELHITSHSLPGMVWQLERDKEGRYLIDEAVAVAPEVLLPEDASVAEAVFSLLPDPPEAVKRADLIRLLEGQFKRTRIDQGLKELLQAGRIEPADMYGHYRNKLVN
jgi:hypothetical protein